MKLNILVWNLNFIHNNWSERLECINQTLEKEIGDVDIIALQEATLPFSEKITEIYKFLKEEEANYFPGAELFFERDLLYTHVKTFFPKYKGQIVAIFEYLMDQLLYICCLISSRYGESLKDLYFQHPYVCIFLAMLCPIIFLGSWLFIGMLTIIRPRIKGIVKSKYVGRALQYIEFEFNGKKIIFVNIHLTSGEKREKRLKEIRNIDAFTKNADIVLLGGDFNTRPGSPVYTFLEENGYRSASVVWSNEEQHTYPSNKPIKCIDYIWLKGEGVEVADYTLFGDSKATDHKGIKVSLEIK